MKRHLNTSYRLVWNHITGTLVVASELARSRGKRAGVAVALSLAAVTSVPALAADKVVQAGETVNDGTLTNHDNQIVFGTANGMTISTGLELGPDSEENTGGQWIQNGGIAGNTTVTTNGRQVVLEGGTASDTVIRDGGGQSLNGLAVNTTLNNRGEQWVHEGGVATGTIINRDGYDNFPEISEANILSTFEQLHQNKDEVFERGVINVFRGLNWNYKTNCPCRFGSKIIVNNLVRWDRWGFHLITGQQADRLADLERMLHLFSGKPIPDNRGNITLRLDDHIQSVQGKESYEDEMFSIRYFKKGSAHIMFRKPELVDRLNDIIAKHYPDMLAV